MQRTNVLSIQRISAEDRAKIEAVDPAIQLADTRPAACRHAIADRLLHPDNGNPPRAGAYRPRLDRSQPIARKPVQQRIRETMGQHVRHGPAMRRIGK
jgi:hypothetical protein